MNNFISNILPRLNSYLKQLNDIECLIDRPWVSIDSDKSIVKYFFRRNNELLISQNGNVIKGKWEFLEFANSLLLEYGNQSQLFNKVFILPNVLILKKDSVDIYQIIFDEKKIPDLQIEKYLLKIIEQGLSVYNKTGHLKKYLKSKQSLIIHQKSIENINLGDAVYFENMILVPDGHYKIDFFISILVRNGEVVEVY